MSAPTAASVKPYFDWITERFGDQNMACLCTPACLEMKVAFPELLLMSGDVTTEDGGVYEHTWLQTDTMPPVVIDPTESQFPTPVAEYDATLCDSTDPEQRVQVEDHFKTENP